MKKKTTATIKVIAGVFLIMLELTQGSLVLPNNAEAAAHGLLSVLFFTLGVYWLVSGAREIVKRKSTRS